MTGPRPAIVVEALGKRYRRGRSRGEGRSIGGSLLHALGTPQRMAARLGGARPAEPGPGSDLFWAIKDISFEVGQGEVIGLVGPNGAGKSTLLKILSRITEPTLGRASIRGRVGSLLEVGTGFHPHLTGRENIYLNGALMGMRRSEINRSLDEIVDFAGVDSFLDTPVRFYSSGMYVRLAFAVAAHLQPEILLVDEVLAVGDAAFQEKCLGKMSSVARAGRTIIFVSHNMTAVTLLCSRALWIDHGRVLQEGPAREIVAAYLTVHRAQGGEKVWEDPATAPGNDNVRLRAARVICDGQPVSDVPMDREVTIEIEFWNRRAGLRLRSGMTLFDHAGNIVLSTSNLPSSNLLPEKWYGRPHPAGLFRSRCTLPANFLNDIQYAVNVHVVTDALHVEAGAEQVLTFRVLDSGAWRKEQPNGAWPGVVRIPAAWETEFVGETALEPEPALSSAAPAPS